MARWLDKDLSPALEYMTRDQLAVLLHAMHLGDGDKHDRLNRGPSAPIASAPHAASWQTGSKACACDGACAATYPWIRGPSERKRIGTFTSGWIVITVR